MKSRRGLLVNHLKRPLVRSAWSRCSVSLRGQQGSERKRSQEVVEGGEAEGAPPSLAARDTSTLIGREDPLRFAFIHHQNKALELKSFFLKGSGISFMTALLALYYIISSFMKENANSSYMYFCCYFRDVCAADSFVCTFVHAQGPLAQNTFYCLFYSVPLTIC